MSLDGAQLNWVNDAGDVVTHVVKGRKCKVGSYVDCDLVLPDAERVHCEIQCDAFGRICIHNYSRDKPILLNDQIVDTTSQRPLYHGARIQILDSVLTWNFPKSSETLTPQRAPPDPAPNSTPTITGQRQRRQFDDRLTVYTFRYSINSDDEGNTSIESRKLENSTCSNEADSSLKVEEEEPDRCLTPSPKQADEAAAKSDLLEATQNKENTSTTSNKLMLELCARSDMVITSFSPRETGVKIEKSFTCVMKPSALAGLTPTVGTPKSVYNTPKGVLSELNEDSCSRDLMEYSTPSTSKKALAGKRQTSMYLIDLTTPQKLRPKLSATPRQTPGSAAIISVDSTDDSSFSSPSVIDISGSSTPSTTPLSSTPALKSKGVVSKTPMRTPQSLMKRALLASAKKQNVKDNSLSQPPQTQSPATPLPTPNRQSLIEARRQCRTTARRLPFHPWPQSRYKERGQNTVKAPLTSPRKRHSTLGNPRDTKISMIRKSMAAASKISPISSKIVAKARRALNSPKHGSPRQIGSPRANTPLANQQNVSTTVISPMEALACMVTDECEVSKKIVKQRADESVTTENPKHEVSSKPAESAEDVDNGTSIEINTSSEKNPLNTTFDLNVSEEKSQVESIKETIEDSSETKTIDDVVTEEQSTSDLENMNNDLTNAIATSDDPVDDIIEDIICEEVTPTIEPDEDTVGDSNIAEDTICEEVPASEEDTPKTEDDTDSDIKQDIEAPPGETPIPRRSSLRFSTEQNTGSMTPRRSTRQASIEASNKLELDSQPTRPRRASCSAAVESQPESIALTTPRRKRRLTEELSTPTRKSQRLLCNTPKRTLPVDESVGDMGVIVEEEVAQSEVPLVTDEDYGTELPEQDVDGDEPDRIDYQGMRDLLSTPKSCSTPHFKGLREMIRTPKVHPSPMLDNIDQLMESVSNEATTPKRSLTVVKRVALEVTKPEITTGEFQDLYFKTPRGKDLMIPNEPASAVLKTRDNSLATTTEYDLNATNMTLHLDKIFDDVLTSESVGPSATLNQSENEIHITATDTGSQGPLTKSAASQSDTAKSEKLLNMSLSVSACEDPLTSTVPKKSDNGDLEVSGIQMLDQTSDSMFSEPLIVTGESLNESKEEATQTSLAEKLEVTLGTDSMVGLSEPLFVSDDEEEDTASDSKIIESEQVINSSIVKDNLADTEMISNDSQNQDITNISTDRSRQETADESTIYLAEESTIDEIGPTQESIFKETKGISNQDEISPTQESIFIEDNDDEISPTQESIFKENNIISNQDEISPTQESIFKETSDISMQDAIEDELKTIPEETKGNNSTTKEEKIEEESNLVLSAEVQEEIVEEAAEQSSVLVTNISDNLVEESLTPDTKSTSRVSNGAEDVPTEPKVQAPTQEEVEINLTNEIQMEETVDATNISDLQNPVDVKCSPEDKSTSEEATSVMEAPTADEQFLQREAVVADAIEENPEQNANVEESVVVAAKPSDIKSDEIPTESDKQDTSQSVSKIVEPSIDLDTSSGACETLDRLIEEVSDTPNNASSTLTNENISDNNPPSTNQEKLERGPLIEEVKVSKECSAIEYPASEEHQTNNIDNSQNDPESGLNEESLMNDVTENLQSFVEGETSQAEVPLVENNSSIAVSLLPPEEVPKEKLESISIIDLGEETKTKENDAQVDDSAINEEGIENISIVNLMDQSTSGNNVQADDSLIDDSIVTEEVSKIELDSSVDLGQQSVGKLDFSQDEESVIELSDSVTADFGIAEEEIVADKSLDTKIETPTEVNNKNCPISASEENIAVAVEGDNDVQEIQMPETLSASITEKTIAPSDVGEENVEETPADINNKNCPTLPIEENTTVTAEQNNDVEDLKMSEPLSPSVSEKMVTASDFDDKNVEESSVTTSSNANEEPQVIADNSGPGKNSSGTGKNELTLIESDNTLGIPKVAEISNVEAIPIDDDIFMVNDDSITELSVEKPIEVEKTGEFLDDHAVVFIENEKDVQLCQLIAEDALATNSNKSLIEINTSTLAIEDSIEINTEDPPVPSVKIDSPIEKDVPVDDNENSDVSKEITQYISEKSGQENVSEAESSETLAEEQVISQKKDISKVEVTQESQLDSLVSTTADSSKIEHDSNVGKGGESNESSKSATVEETLQEMNAENKQDGQEKEIDLSEIVLKVIDLPSNEEECAFDQIESKNSTEVKSSESENDHPEAEEKSIVESTVETDKKTSFDAFASSSKDVSVDAAKDITIDLDDAGEKDAPVEKVMEVRAPASTEIDIKGNKEFVESSSLHAKSQKKNTPIVKPDESKVEHPTATQQVKEKNDSVITKDPLNRIDKEVVDVCSEEESSSSVSIKPRESITKAPESVKAQIIENESALVDLISSDDEEVFPTPAEEIKKIDVNTRIDRLNQDTDKQIGPKLSIDPNEQNCQSEQQSKTEPSKQTQNLPEQSEKSQNICLELVEKTEVKKNIISEMDISINYGDDVDYHLDNISKNSVDVGKSSGLKHSVEVLEEIEAKDTGVSESKPSELIMPIEKILDSVSYKPKRKGRKPSHDVTESDNHVEMKLKPVEKPTRRGRKTSDRTDHVEPQSVENTEKRNTEQPRRRVSTTSEKSVEPEVPVEDVDEVEKKLEKPVVEKPKRRGRKPSEETIVPDEKPKRRGRKASEKVTETDMNEDQKVDELTDMSVPEKPKPHLRIPSVEILETDIPMASKAKVPAENPIAEKPKRRGRKASEEVNEPEIYKVEETVIPETVKEMPRRRGRKASTDSVDEPEKQKTRITRKTSVKVVEDPKTFTEHLAVIEEATELDHKKPKIEEPVVHKNTRRGRKLNMTVELVEEPVKSTTDEDESKKKATRNTRKASAEVVENPKACKENFSVIEETSEPDQKKAKSEEPEVHNTRRGRKPNMTVELVEEPVKSTTDEDESEKKATRNTRKASAEVVENPKACKENFSVIEETSEPDQKKTKSEEPEVHKNTRRGRKPNMTAELVEEPVKPATDVDTEPSGLREHTSTRGGCKAITDEIVEAVEVKPKRRGRKHSTDEVEPLEKPTRRGRKPSVDVDHTVSGEVNAVAEKKTTRRGAKQAPVELIVEEAPHPKKTTTGRQGRKTSESTSVEVDVEKPNVETALLAVSPKPQQQNSEDELTPRRREGRNLPRKNYDETSDEDKTGLASRKRKAAASKTTGSTSKTTEGESSPIQKTPTKEKPTELPTSVAEVDTPSIANEEVPEPSNSQKREGRNVPRKNYTEAPDDDKPGTSRARRIRHPTAKALELLVDSATRPSTPKRRAKAKTEATPAIADTSLNAEEPSEKKPLLESTPVVAKTRGGARRKVHEGTDDVEAVAATLTNPKRGARNHKEEVASDEAESISEQKPPAKRNARGGNTRKAKATDEDIEEQPSNKKPRGGTRAKTPVASEPEPMSTPELDEPKEVQAKKRGPAARARTARGAKAASADVQETAQSTRAGRGRKVHFDSAVESIAEVKDAPAADIPKRATRSRRN